MEKSQNIPYWKANAGESEDNTESESENSLGLGHFAWTHSETDLLYFLWTIKVNDLDHRWNIKYDVSRYELNSVKIMYSQLLH